MMLTKQERELIQTLIQQAPYDTQYMRHGWDDPNSHYTRGICSRHQEMANLLERLLETNAAAVKAETK